MKKTTLKLICIILLGIGLIGEFITTLVWWTKIKPWYSHGKNTVKSLYTVVYFTWVFSLIVIIVLIIDLLLYIYTKHESIDKIVNATYVLAAIIIITTAVCYSYSSQGLSKYIDGKPFDIKCYDDLFESIEYIEAWAKLNGKLSKYNDWFEKIESKIIKYDSNGEIDHFTNYLCKNFGTPALVFTCIISVSMSYYSYTYIREPLFEIPKSENENTENIEANQKVDENS